MASTRAAKAPSAPPPDSVSKKRWAGALLLGMALFAAAVFASYVLPQVALGLSIEGPVYALVGGLQALLALGAVAGALRVAGLRLRDVGLTTVQWRSDASIGAAIAVAFALIQFLVVIPNTGGAARSDVAMNSAQIGNSVWGVAGFVVLAWTGGFAEELFFRGHFITTLQKLLGESRAALIATVAATIVLFAVLHGYQGWAGVLDTGLYGGLTLTLLYLWRGRRLTACVVAHALWNTIAVVSIFLWY